MVEEKIAFTVSEASQAIGVGRSLIYRLIAQKRLAAIKVDGRTLVPASSLRQLIATSPAAAINIKPGKNP